MLIGSQISLTIGLVGVFLSLLIGSVLGVASGYYGGWIDDVIQRADRGDPVVPVHPALDGAGGGVSAALAGRCRCTSRSAWCCR